MNTERENLCERNTIPKVIHYCWFGYGEKTDLMINCINSWKKYCPDWEIVEWNEENFDVNLCPYTKKAYEQKRYGFLTDVARLKIIYESGGVYLDTDVELRRSLNELLNCEAWFGYGTKTEINTGSGFGAVKNQWFIKALLDSYLVLTDKDKFEVCTKHDTRVFKKYFPDFAGDGSEQCFGNIVILGNIWHYVIHHYTNTWKTDAQKARSKSKTWNLIRKIIKKSDK